MLFEILLMNKQESRNHLTIVPDDCDRVVSSQVPQPTKQLRNLTSETHAICSQRRRLQYVLKEEYCMVQYVLKEEDYCIVGGATPPCAPPPSPRT